MSGRLRFIVILVFSGALILGAFFAVMSFKIIREVDQAPRSQVLPVLPVGDELNQLLPTGRVGAVTQGLVDLDGNGAAELVIGYALASDADITKSAPRPQLRAFRKTKNSWRLISEFSFPIDKQIVDANSWSLLSNAPSFEKKDFNNDGQEELFVRLDAGSTAYRAVAVVAWQNSGLTWLPMFNSLGQPRLSLFRDGETTAESWRIFFENADNEGGLELVTAHGLAREDGVKQWEYEVYFERDGVYVYDPAVSSNLTTSGRAPSE